MTVTHHDPVNTASNDIGSASPVGTHSTSHSGCGTEARAGVEGKKRESKGYGKGIARFRMRVTTESTESNCLSPISEVPDEIWDYIFTELCSSHDYTLSYAVGKEKHVESPALALSQVCTQWRNVARSRPQFWSSISVDLFQSGHDIRSLLEVYFTNSRDHPLKLRIADLPGLDDLPSPAVSCEEYLGRNGFMAFQLLLQQASRWQELFLNAAHWRLLALPDHPEVSFSMLHRLTCLADMDVVVDDTRWFWNSISKAPNLVEVDLNSLMDFDVIPYTQITSLSIDVVDDLGDLCQTLQMCTMLEELIIDDCYLVIEDELPLEVVLPNLQRLILNAASTSNLEPIFTLFTTPSLNDLQVDYRSASDRNSDVEAMEWSLSLVESLLERSDCSLERLTIILPASLYLTQQSLTDLLKRTPDLQTMFISFHSLQGSALNTSTLFSMLKLPPPESSDPSEPEPMDLVPELDALFVHEQRGVLDSKIIDNVLDMLESRCMIRFIDESGLINPKVAIVDFRDKIMDRRNVGEYLELKPVPFDRAVLSRLWALQRYGPTAFAAYL